MLMTNSNSINDISNNESYINNINNWNENGNHDTSDSNENTHNKSNNHISKLRLQMSDSHSWRQLAGAGGKAIAVVSHNPLKSLVYERF